MNSLWARMCLLVVVTMLFQDFSFVSSRNRINIYAHAYGDAEGVHSHRDPKVRACRDRKKHSIRRNGKRYKICDWVAKNPEDRCKKPILKLRRGKRRRFRIKIDPAKYCGCTCLSSTKVSCPAVTTDPIRDVHQASCDGYEKGKTCDYDWIWVGCTYAELRCQPVARCTCGNPFRSTEPPVESPTQPPKPNEWMCAMSVVEYCPPSREEPIPPQHQTPCRENETLPLPPIII